MSTSLSHPSVRIAHPKLPGARRWTAQPARGWWSRVGDYLVAAGESATHHRIGSWTRR